MRLQRWLILPVVAAIWSPARATSAYAYGKNETVVIKDGVAPNGHLSLASHGDGDPPGDGKFSIYLMGEPAHRRTARLEGITENDILDSAPTAFEASWAPDSRHAAVAFRAERHVIVTRLYRIEGQRAIRIDGASLFKQVTSKDRTSPGDDERASVTKLTWQGPRRFLLEEMKWFLASPANLPRSLGRYGKRTDEKNGERVLIKFSAQATCEFVHGNRYRILDMQPAISTNSGRNRKFSQNPSE
jgi:hypothetical protein